MTKEAAKRSQDLTIGSSKLSYIVSETDTRSKEIAADQASKISQLVPLGFPILYPRRLSIPKSSLPRRPMRADHIKTEAIKRADLIKYLAEAITPAVAICRSDTTVETQQEVKDKELERFGITEELREFVKEITLSTFQDFPLQGNIQVKISIMPT